MIPHLLCLFFSHSAYAFACERRTQCVHNSPLGNEEIHNSGKKAYAIHRRLGCRTRHRRLIRIYSQSRCVCLRVGCPLMAVSKFARANSCPNVMPKYVTCVLPPRRLVAIQWNIHSAQHGACLPSIIWGRPSDINTTMTAR